MRKNVSVFPILIEPLGDDFSFPGMILADELHSAVESGVSQSIATTVAFDDEGSTEIDPIADIRTNRLDMAEAQIVSTGDALLGKLVKNYEEVQALKTPPAAPQPTEGSEA